MSMPRSRRFQRGMTFIELLVAALILAVGLMSLMGVWLYAFGITRRTDEVGIAYSLARQAMERQRTRGYLYAAPVVEWYSPSETQLPDNNGAYYRVGVTISSENSYPAANAYRHLKEVEVSVTRVSDGAALCTTQSYLVLGGI